MLQNRTLLIDTETLAEIKKVAEDDGMFGTFHYYLTEKRLNIVTRLGSIDLVQKGEWLNISLSKQARQYGFMKNIFRKMNEEWWMANSLKADRRAAIKASLLYWESMDLDPLIVPAINSILDL